MPQPTGSTLFGEDVVTPFLHLKTQQRFDLVVPEKALMFAVLADAVETYQKSARSKSRRRQMVFREAEDWFWNDDSGYLFSFTRVCEALGFDPAFLRRGLLQWVADRQRGALPRIRMQRHAVRNRARGPLRISARKLARASSGHEISI